MIQYSDKENRLINIIGSRPPLIIKPCDKLYSPRAFYIHFPHNISESISVYVRIATYTRSSLLLMDAGIIDNELILLADFRTPTLLDDYHIKHYQYFRICYDCIWIGELTYKGIIQKISELAE